MAADRQTIERILKSVPQKEPFRFIDEVLELDDDHVVGAYRFRTDEFFYRGHFPDSPVTPGVILIETMAQTGVVAYGIYLNMVQTKVQPEDTGKMITLFTAADNVEFTGMVKPGERMIIRGSKVYFRNRSIKAKVTMERENGEPVCSGILSGMGVVLA